MTASRFPHRAHTACLLLPAVWWMASYIAWLSKGCRPFLPFLSDFDLMPPEGSFFTLGTTLQGLALLVVLIQLHQRQAQRIRVWGLSKKWTWLNHAGFLPGIVASLGSVAVGWVPWNEAFILHGRLAMGTFVGGLVWGTLSCILTARLARVEPRFAAYLRWRLVAALVAFVSLVGMLSVVGQVFDGGGAQIAALVARSHDQALFCHEVFDPRLTIAASLEWLLIGALIFAVATLREELSPIRSDKPSPQLPTAAKDPSSIDHTPG